jgi:hypothetical protein
LTRILESRQSQILSQEELNLLRALKIRKEKILATEESTWRLKSPALWMQNGDKNTRFFHKYATQRRLQNSIWDITNDDGVTLSSESEIKEHAYNFFKSQFEAPEAEDMRISSKS